MKRILTIIIYLMYINTANSQNNIAVGKTYFGNHLGSTGIAPVFDGDFNTSYGAGSNVGCPIHFGVQFNNIYEVTSLAFYEKAYDAGVGIHEIYSSMDGINWKLEQIENLFHPFSPFNLKQHIVTLSQPFDCRYIKINTISYPSIHPRWYEIQVWGNLSCASHTTDTISNCGPITWIDGLTYENDTKNIATHRIKNGASLGCDSIVTLDYKNLISSGVDVSNICGPYT